MSLSLAPSCSLRRLPLCSLKSTNFPFFLSHSSDKRLAKVAFTGSVASGRKVNACAASNGIPTTMELGGKSALLVFDDADVEKAVEWCMVGACMPPASSLACSNHTHMQSTCSVELAEQHVNFCSRLACQLFKRLAEHDLSV